MIWDLHRISLSEDSLLEDGMDILLSSEAKMSDFNLLRAEITKSTYFNNDQTSDAEFNEHLLGYWRKISDDKGTEELIETAYRQAWASWKKEADELRIARAGFRLALFVIHAMDPNEFTKELMEFAVKSFTSKLGENNAETAQAINDLGYVFDKIGKKRKSLALYKKALAIRRNIFSVPSADIAESLNNVASHYSDRMALPYLRESLEMRKATLGEAHADTMNSIRNQGATLDMLGRTDEADAMFIAAIKTCEAAFGEHSDEVADALDYYGIFLWHNEFYELAPSVSLRSIEIKEKLYGKESVKLLESLHILAQAYYYNKQFDEANSVVKRGVKIIHQSHDDWASYLETFEGITKQIEKSRDRELLNDPDDSQAHKKFPIN